MSKYINNMIIEEAYVSYELAKLLNEKGFDVSCLSTYDINNGKQYFHTSYIMCATRINAPTHQLAMAWLREKGYYINVCSVFTIEKTWVFSWEGYYKWGVKFWSGGSYHNSLEEATEEALKYCLTNLI